MPLSDEILPRYEFRAFAASFEHVERSIRLISPCKSAAESLETYLVAPGVQDRNVKSRRGKLEVKQLVEVRERLERWKPVAEEVFPLSREFVAMELAPALGLGRLALERSEYSLDELLAALRRAQARVVPALVSKRRFRFVIEGCSTEIDELRIDGTDIRSVAVESADAEAVLGVIARIGLAGCENVNYPRAIRRILGLEALPGARDPRR